MLAKLSEVFFAETLRRYQRELPRDQTGWWQAPAIRRWQGLTLFHNRHAHPWTIPELAREVGVSRTVLSERFRHFLGEAPMTYLTRWRLQLARARVLSTTGSVAQVRQMSLRIRSGIQQGLQARVWTSSCEI
jgi:transcriptional regulator GlxA family with amidase domain